VEYDADRFWEAWQAAKEIERPTRLTVSRADAAWGETIDWAGTKAGRE